jgi:hypothetical protein
VNFPLVEALEYETFASSGRGTGDVQLPICKTIGEGCFSYGDYLYGDFPELVTTENSGFCHSHFVELNLPKLTSTKDTDSWGNGCFEGSQNLTKVNLQSCSYIGKDAFRNCLSLIEINLEGNQFCQLANAEALKGTKFFPYAADEEYDDGYGQSDYYWGIKPPRIYVPF